MRLQKYLAECGIESRRKSETLIQSGKVLVNGKKALLGQKINSEKDVVWVLGKQVKPQNQLYFLLNKPKGYLSTVSDPFKRKTILDLVKIPEKIYPVGRLDKDSEGLILLTNDGALAYALTHPKFKVEKVYEVEIGGIPSLEIIQKIQEGVLLEDGMTAPCQVRVVQRFKGKNQTLLEIKIYEGRKREIRRMMQKFGYPVISLRRIAIGPLQLKNLPSGAFRPLHLTEIKLLQQLKIIR